MASHIFSSHEWALILGGSSGFGLASAKKLAAEGLSICIVHRDRRGAMRRIEPEFDQIRALGTELLTFNTDALSDDGRDRVLQELTEALGSAGKIRLLLHSIAFGNLKLIAPEAAPDDRATERLAGELGTDAGALMDAADRLFEEGVDGVAALTHPPDYPSDRFIEDEDVARTVYAMGTSLLTWTQAIYSRGLFATDSRVLGLTSEGNAVAWKGYAAVSAAKAALESVSRSIAYEMAHMGIRSNIVQAGVTDTPALRAIPGSAHLKAQARTRNPFRRLTRPEDVADVVYLLCLPEAHWINGEIVRADGGERISGASR